MRKTEPKTAAVPVKNNEERLSFVINSAGVGTWDWYIDTSELLWSDLSLQMFGLAPGTKMTYERFLNALHPDDRERISTAIQNTLERGTRTTSRCGRSGRMEVFTGQHPGVGRILTNRVGRCA